MDFLNFENSIKNTEEIKQYQTEMGFDVIAVLRMHTKVEEARVDLPLVPVQLSSTSKNNNFFILPKLEHLLIKVEPQQVRTSIPQCHQY